MAGADADIRLCCLSRPAIKLGPKGTFAVPFPIRFGGSRDKTPGSGLGREPQYCSTKASDNAKEHGKAKGEAHSPLSLIDLSAPEEPGLSACDRPLGASAPANSGANSLEFSCGLFCLLVTIRFPSPEDVPAESQEFSASGHLGFTVASASLFDTFMESFQLRAILVGTECKFHANPSQSLPPAPAD